MLEGATTSHVVYFNWRASIIILYLKENIISKLFGCRYSQISRGINVDCLGLKCSAAVPEKTSIQHFDAYYCFEFLIELTSKKSLQKHKRLKADARWTQSLN